MKINSDLEKFMLIVIFTLIIGLAVNITTAFAVSGPGIL